jgi:hypothetical protein
MIRVKMKVFGAILRQINTLKGVFFMLCFGRFTNRQKIWTNPHPNTIKSIINNSKYGTMRYVVDPETGDYHMGYADHMVHDDIVTAKDVLDTADTGKGFLQYFKGSNKIAVYHDSNSHHPTHQAFFKKMAQGGIAHRGNNNDRYRNLNADRSGEKLEEGLRKTA